MFPEKEVRELSYRYSKELAPSQIREILNYWMDRRPMNLPPDMLRKVFVDPSFLFKRAEDIVKYLKERDWRGAIVSVVGEYGSGKTQLGLILRRMLKEEEDVRPYFKSLDSFRDVREVLLEDVTFDDVEPLVLIVDEVDQLLSELYRGKRGRIEELADIVRAITEGSVSPPAGSVVLLMSTRAKGELASDRSLANRLIARAREFRLAMTDEEREKAALEAVKKVLSLFMALESAYDVYKHFDVLYEFLTSRARSLAQTMEIGGIVKEITLTLKEILDRLDPNAEIPSGVVELGKALEDALKSYLRERASAVPFQVTVGDRIRHYLAKFSDERVRVDQSISDGQYTVHTYDPSRNLIGSPVSKVLVEVKTGTTWINNAETKRQIQSFLKAGPVLLFWLSDQEEDLLPVEGSLRVIIQDPSPFKVSMILRGGKDLLDSWVNLKRDVAENMEFLMIPTSVGGTGGDREEEVEVVASAIASAVLIELKKAKSYKKISTLHSAILNAIQYTYNQMGKAPPTVSPSLLDSLLRVFVKEGLGRFSRTGKTVQIGKDNRIRIMELEANPGRRKRLEEEVRELLKKVLSS